jgi:hypothetical protein
VKLSSGDPEVDLSHAELSASNAKRLLEEKEFPNVDLVASSQPQSSNSPQQCLSFHSQYHRIRTGVFSCVFLVLYALAPQILYMALHCIVFT